MEESILTAIQSLTRTAAGIPGGLEAMKAAMASVQETQTAQVGWGSGEILPQEGQRLGENQEAVSSETSETVEEMEPASGDFEAGFGSDLAGMPEDTAEPEVTADQGQAEEEGPSLVPDSGRYPAERILTGEVPEDAVHDLMGRWKSGLVGTASEVQPAEDNAPAVGETPIPDLADSLDSAGDVLDRALSEIRMMMDQVKFSRGVDPDQVEQLMQEIAATREGVLALDAVVTELLGEVRTGQVALEAMKSAMPDSSALNELHGQVIEQHRSLEAGLTQFVRETQEVCSKGNADLGNFLGAELAKLHQPLAASQEAMGQLVNSVSGIEGMKSKLVQTWRISVFWLAVVVIYILIRSGLSFLG